MGLLDRIKWHNASNILALFFGVMLLLLSIYGVMRWMSSEPAPTTITALSPADYERITAPMIRYSDSAYLARDASTRRRSDSLMGKLFPMDSLLKLFQQNQSARDEKYDATANASDSVLLHQWQRRYGSN